MHELLLLTLSHFVEGGPAVLRSQCNPGAAAVAILDPGSEVRVKFTIAGLETPCVKVAVAGGIEGYLSPSELREQVQPSLPVPSVDSQAAVPSFPLNAFQPSMPADFFERVARAVPARRPRRAARRRTPPGVSARLSVPTIHVSWK